MSSKSVRRVREVVIGLRRPPPGRLPIDRTGRVSATGWIRSCTRVLGAIVRQRCYSGVDDRPRRSSSEGKLGRFVRNGRAFHRGGVARMIESIEATSRTSGSIRVNIAGCASIGGDGHRLPSPDLTPDGTDGRLTSPKTFQTPILSCDRSRIRRRLAPIIAHFDRLSSLP